MTISNRTSTHPSERRALAAGLRRAARMAETPHRSAWPVSPLDRASAQSAATDLREVADRLTGPTEVPDEAVRMVQELLVDGSGPLYRPGRSAELRSRLGQAMALTDGR